MGKILIIDDEKELVMLLEDELRARGHDVLAAYDGYEGIRQAKIQPDLVILDIMMPGINGFEVCRAIRDDVLCPIIFLSARQSEADMIKTFRFGPLYCQTIG
ncbi:response regulator [Clostridium sp. Marseille-P2415]|uniref:response regulator n=1 Tax=Clostridium sp. Marseille-P2415 TaxID=1805471 RepID=UPI000988768A